MDLTIGLILEMRRVKLVDGKYRNIYKLADVTYGIFYEINSITTFLPINSSICNDMLYLISDSNMKELGDKFNVEGYFCGLLNFNRVEKIFDSVDNDIDAVRRKLFNSYSCYRYLVNGHQLEVVKNSENIEILDNVFKNKLNSDIESNNKSKEENNVLEKYGTFLTDKKYLFNPAICRDKEIERLERSLLGYDYSAILVGESGVGKTAIVEGLAYKIQKGLVHNKIKNYEIVSVSPSSMISGCHYVGDKEKRMELIINELKNNKNIIMFIDEIHNVIGAGRGEKSNLDIANILKPYLDRGDIKIIGSTTNEEYNTLMNDNAFKRRFKKINVLEPNEVSLYQILDGVIEGLEKYFNINFSFNEEVKNNIYEILYNLTNKKNIDYKEKGNNPDLILFIIKEAFSIALYNYHEEVLIDDIVSAIDECDRFYQTSKDKYKLQLKRVLLKDSVMKEKQDKVLNLTIFDSKKPLT